MALDSLADYKALQDYKNDLKTSTAKAKTTALPFRLVKEFEFSNGKGWLLIVGKPSATLAKDLKAAKVKAEGLCKVIGDTKDAVLEFEVDKGSLVPNDLTAVFKAVGAERPARVVTAFSDAAAANLQVKEAAALKQRAAALRAGLNKLKDAPLELTKALGALDELIERGADRGDIEDAFDGFETQLATALRGRAPPTDKQVAEHLGNKDKNPVVPTKDQGDHGVDVDESLRTFGKKIDTLEQAFEKLLADPNGALLANKQIQALGATLAALIKQPKPVEVKAAQERAVALKEATERLKKLAQLLPQKLSPQDMQKQIEQRQAVLGRDAANSKDVPQEGEVGSDVEMSLGGLTRATTAEVEFKAGEFSPHAKGSETDQPRQFDVFGLTPDVVRKLMLMHARRQYAALKKADDDELWEALRMMSGPGKVRLGLMDTDADVVPQVVFQSFLDENKNSSKSRSFFKSLEDHFAKGGKPTIVPFDVRGMSRWPALLGFIKTEVAKSFPKQQHLIIWRD